LKRGDREKIYAEVQSGQHDLGRSIYLMRRVNGLSRKVFSEKLGVSVRTLTRIETGEGNPSLSTLQKIVRVFGFEVGFIRRRALPSEGRDRDN